MLVKPEIAVNRDHFSDLVYADNGPLFVDSASEGVTCLGSFKETVAKLGLRVLIDVGSPINAGSLLNTGLSRSVV